MTLRQRLVIAFGLLALLAAALYGTLTFVVHQRQQWAQLEALLERELDRMQEVLASPQLGVPLLAAERSGTLVQLVNSRGVVVLPRGAGDALPAAEEPELVTHEQRQYLAALRRLPGGNTVRIGLDVGAELASRRALAGQLVWLGLTLSAAAALLGGLLARRALAPLAALARQARRIDPSAPNAITYRGPPDEVGEVASALNAALANIRRRRDEERAFLAEVAHELAAPLTLVKGHLDAYQRDEAASGDPQMTGEHLRAAREAAQELLLTSQDLLALARGELEHVTQKEVFRLDELLERLERSYPGIELVLEGSGVVVGDRHQLLQAVRNLVRNAVQASGGTSGVRVELTENGKLVKLRVRDRGPGIPRDRLERIFERYFSGSSGAGVGLTVVRRVVEQHGGELRVDSGPSGSCFELLLPSFAAQLATTP